MSIPVVQSILTTNFERIIIILSPPIQNSFFGIFTYAEEVVTASEEAGAAFDFVEAATAAKAAAPAEVATGALEAVSFFGGAGDAIDGWTKNVLCKSLAPWIAT